MAKRNLEKSMGKATTVCPWECSAPFADDGFGVYHYAMISTMETGNKLQYISIFCFALDTSF